MVINGNVYNHLSTTLVPKKRNITHKSSDLKAVYNNMAKHNKNSPLYLLDFSESKQSYIINIKEAALTLKDTSDVFSNTDNTLYSKKTFRSDNEASVSGSIKSSDLGDLPDSFTLDVKSLATEQTNIGNYLDADKQALVSKKHTFTIDTTAGSAKLAINVTPQDTNLDVQRRLANTINDRSIGVTASIVSEGNANALMLTSVETGVPDSNDGLRFHISSTSNGQDMVSILGLNNVSAMPTNSTFDINGEIHTSASNHIAINHVVELDFHQTSDKPVNISFVPDTSLAMEYVDAFIDSYNKLVDLSKMSGSLNPGTRNLGKDISGIANNHKNELSGLGIIVNDEGKLEKDAGQLSKTLESGEFNELFANISTFKADVEKTTDRLTIDPIAYVNKLIVTYPNKGNRFDTPYTQSLYSGLIYNNYA